MNALNATFFKNRNWKPHAFQNKCATLYANGYSGLLNAPTGSGKTYAIAIPAIVEALQNPNQTGLQLLWISPLKALGTDISLAIQSAANELNLNWNVAVRNGDTETKIRQKQKLNIPNCLVITPESLHLMLATKDCSNIFKNLKCIVADEWHELMGNKRGVQVELAVSRLKSFSPKLKVWGISATIGNLDEALNTLLPFASKSELVIANFTKKFEIKTIIPAQLESFPWNGHMGLTMMDEIVPIIENAQTILVFTNTRNQSEVWYQKILETMPQLAGRIAIHHGSLTSNVRQWVEQNLHLGNLKVVVCTSSLDLGVDFRPVDTVIQIGSPRGVARFVQRAGRSGHQPGQVSKLFFVPTNSLELIESAALQYAMQHKIVESKLPYLLSYDVLIQYLITLSIGEGFNPDKTYLEIKETHAFCNLTLEKWNWIIDFIQFGGQSLGAYNEYKKIEIINGLFFITNRKMALQHRLNIGTIASAANMLVKLTNGELLGTMEETFLTRLEIGDTFTFAGKILSLVSIDGNAAKVRKSKAKKAIVPSWGGGRMSLTSELSDVLKLMLPKVGMVNTPELNALKPLFELQKQISAVPNPDELLLEVFNDKDGHHLFFYPFEGRLVNEGMAILIAYRLSKIANYTFSISMNDYGFELLSEDPIPMHLLLNDAIFSSVNLISDLLNCHNYSQMTQKKFSEIAVISGLVIKNAPKGKIKERHLFANASLVYKVFNEYEPNNLLLLQAKQEVLAMQLEENRLRKAFLIAASNKLVVKYLDVPSPFCFSLLVDRLRETFSNESMEVRIAKMLEKQWQ